MPKWCLHICRAQKRERQDGKPNAATAESLAALVRKNVAEAAQI